jgi:hypothetical protein
METINQLINEIYEDNYSHLEFDENMGGESCSCPIHTTLNTIVKYRDGKEGDDVETVSWSSSNPTGEVAGECDKCAASYDLSSRDNRCGDCGNCDTCCTHKGEVA